VISQLTSSGKLESVEVTMELECYRAEAKVRKQYEDQLVQQLELQHQNRLQEEGVIFTPQKRVEEPEDLSGGQVHVKGGTC